MKQNLKTIAIILGLILVLVVFFQVSSCIKARNLAKISKLEGELKEAGDQAAKIKTDNQTAIDEMWEEIRRQAAEIAAKNGTILELQRQDQAIIPTEIVDVPGEDQDWEKIAGVNARAARDWKAKYYKAQEVIEELGVPIKTGVDEKGNPTFRYPRDSVTWGLHQQYLLSEERARLYKQNWGLAENLNRISKDIIKEKNKQIARLKFGKTIERIITVPLAIYGGFKIGQAILEGE